MRYKHTHNGSFKKLDMSFLEENYEHIDKWLGVAVCNLNNVILNISENIMYIFEQGT